MADKKSKRFERRFIPNDYGGMDTVMVPRREKKGLPYADAPSKMTLEQKIIKKIQERAPKKMGGGMMKKPMGYNKGVMIEKQRPGRTIPAPRKPSVGQDLRDRIKKTLPKTKEGMPVGGKMKKPKPGSYDYQLESTMKPSYKGMRVGGMCRGMGAAIKGGKFEGVK